MERAAGWYWAVTWQTCEFGKLKQNRCYQTHGFGVLRADVFEVIPTLCDCTVFVLLEV
jgi:hypothetical protein